MSSNIGMKQCPVKGSILFSLLRMPNTALEFGGHAAPLHTGRDLFDFSQQDVTSIKHPATLILKHMQSPVSAPNAADPLIRCTSSWFCLLADMGSNNFHDGQGHTLTLSGDVLRVRPHAYPPGHD
jgi:hypothetical protein